MEEESAVKGSHVEEGEGGVKYRRPVRVIRKVIDTKIDQRKPKLEEDPAVHPQKIPRIEPIKIFPHDTTDKHPSESSPNNHPILPPKEKPQPSPVKQSEDDEYEQLYD